MNNQIDRDVFVLTDTLKDPIFYVRGTNSIPIVFRFMDFTIPSDSQAYYYVKKPSGKSSFNLASQLSNTVTVDVKDQDFSELGFCHLQIQIVSGEKTLVSFDQPVVVKENYTDGQSEESKNESDAFVLQNQGIENSGKVLGIDENGFVIPVENGGGSGGTNNYNNLSNRPKINGIVLTGNKTSSDLGLLPENFGSGNSGKFLQIGPDGGVIPAYSNTENGIPAGGTTGQVLKKKSNTDYEVEWADESQSGSGTQNSDYSGKTVVMFGDSIVAGWGWREGTGITEPLKEKYPNGTWTNQAVSGSNMANKSGSDHPSIISKVLAYTGAANGILLEGGTNDVNNAVPIGEITSGYDDTFDESTFTGALESALHTIMDRYPLAYKFFLIPHSFGKDNSYTDTFHDRAIEVCGKWNMPVLDMRKRLQIAMTAQNKAIYTRNPNTDQGDGVHPTEELYRTFYSPLVDQFFRSLGILDDMGGSDPEPPEHVPVTGVTLDQSAITLTAAGQTQQLRATVQPSNATNKSVTWESDHPEYATVTQAGLVQAVANGTAVITVKTQDGNKSAQCSVNVDIDESITHQELPSIVFDNNCYFDTGIYPDVTTNIELKVHVTDPDISGAWVAGARDTNNKYTLSITDNWYVTRGPVSSGAKNAAFWEIDWTIIQDGADFTFNGTKISCDAISDLTINANYYIGNCNNNGEPYTGKGFNGTFYYAKIKSNQELVMDIIPVKKSDGTLCLYDKIGQKYLYNLGSGNLSE